METRTANKSNKCFMILIEEMKDRYGRTIDRPVLPVGENSDRCGQDKSYPLLIGGYDLQTIKKNNGDETGIDLGIMRSIFVHEIHRSLVHRNSRSGINGGRRRLPPCSTHKH